MPYLKEYSTAEKILQGIIDTWISQQRKPGLSLEKMKFLGAGAAWENMQESGKIFSTIAQAIIDAMDYAGYQKLSAKEKNEIRTAIILQLIQSSENFSNQFRYYEKEHIFKPFESIAEYEKFTFTSDQRKGIQYWIAGERKYLVCMKLPDALFLNKDKLAEEIRTAIPSKYQHLIKDEGIMLDNENGRVSPTLPEPKTLSGWLKNNLFPQKQVLDEKEMDFPNQLKRMSIGSSDSN